ncbi:hypothetical protein LEP1GSC043_1699 [Leptospira weilii str. Ecochallenge]|uniref:Uncharacterized protein n=2 Tax=Leptospira weilii TaxID=28184 RepID=N1UGA0_9LEPT|nr:hypothetical protein LEP1GSC038_3828 [Leptospira weilii str. 2006001855]EMY15040.1 hypothetical protein LEP1GSC043_1699 [Leptospira weilii str. Ecochallenge]
MWELGFTVKKILRKLPLFLCRTRSFIRSTNSKTEESGSFKTNLDKFFILSKWKVENSHPIKFQTGTNIRSLI